MVAPPPRVPAPLWYIALVVVGTVLIWKGTGALERSSEELSDHYGLAVSVLLITFALAMIYNPVELPTTRFGARVTRPLALIPVGLYVVYVYLQYLDTQAYDPPAAEEVAVGRQWALLAASLVVIVVGVEGLVEAAVGFGDLLGTPPFLWGLTVIAAGTSIPDALVSVRASRRGEGATSLANVLGSNIFDLTVAIPAGVLIAGGAVVNFGAAVPMLGYLAFATIVLLVTMRTDLELSAREAYALLLVYAAFVGWMMLEAFDVTGVVPGA